MNFPVLGLKDPTSSESSGKNIKKKKEKSDDSPLSSSS
jgi:hypothetical protein